MTSPSLIDLLGRDALLALGAPGGYAHKLALSQFLRQGLLARAIALLGPAPGSRGLDLGCGIGLPTLMLARAVGPDGQVTGLDQSAEFLAVAQDLAQDLAQKLAAKAGLAEIARFQAGDLNQPPFPDNHFDWLISIDAAGYAPCPDPVKLLGDLARVIRPGGALALMAWSGQQLLPGHPLLEARLNATPGGLAPFTPGAPPERHFLRALGWFQRAGLRDPQAHTLLQDLSAPLTPEQRLALLSLLDMRWPGAEDHLSPADHAQYRALTSPDSPDCILDRPDYHAWFTYTLFLGKKP